MRLVVATLTALTAGGCNQLFGLDPGTGDDDAPAADAGGPDGPHRFTEQVMVEVGLTPTEVAAAQLDGMPGLELAVTCRISNMIYVVSCDATRSCGTQAFSAGVSPFSVAPIDIDDDQVLDLAIANIDGNAVQLLLNDGAGRFVPAPALQLANPAWVRAGVFARDDEGDDLVVGQVGTALTVFPSSGGDFGDPSAIVLPELPGAFAVGQLVAGVHSEVLVADVRKVRLLTVGNDGDLAEASGGFDGGATALAITDVDGNGSGDAVLTRSNGSLELYLGDGTGAFTAGAARVAVDAGVHTMAVGDADGDGRADDVILAAANMSNTVRRVRLFHGSDDGSLREGPAFEPTSAATSVALADVDGDGRDDVVMVLGAENRVVIVFAG